ncbi:MAG: hypothetical protein Q9210_001748 [Variospora velana]
MQHRKASSAIPRPEVKLDLHTPPSFGDQCPVIFDEVYTLVGSEYPSSDWEYCGGLSGPSNHPVALLSMSGYEKTPHPFVDDYTTCGALPVGDSHSMYEDIRSLESTNPITYGHLESSTQQATLYDQETGRLALSPAFYREAPAAYDTQTDDAQSCPRSCPQVSEWRPSKGPPGTQFYIFIKSEDDLKHPSYPRIILMFANRQCPAILTRVESYSTTYNFVLTADVPPLSSTGWQGSEVPVRLHFQNLSGASAGMIKLGLFSYTAHQRSFVSSPRGLLRGEDSLTDTTLSTAASKLAVSQQLLPGKSCAHPSGSYGSRSPSYGSVSRSIPHSTSAPRFSPYEAARNNYSRRVSAVSSSSVSTCLPPMPGAERWSSEYAVAGGPRRSSVITGVAPATNSPFISTTANATPLLYRKSQLVKEECPYRHWIKGPNATLHIYGDPESMARNWTPAEKANKRRLVQFWRTQSGTSVSAGFKPVAAEEKPPGTICVSCIWWEERGECFFTSVDNIQILELVAGYPFIVEEQNRIRRNVENMSPTTIRKRGKENEGEEGEEGIVVEGEGEDLFNLEEFFKLVMGFNNPRPRNIEKCLKVFPWRLIGPILMKIMGKYCAIYPPTTNTAGGLRPSIEMQMDMDAVKTEPDNRKDVPSHACAPTSPNAKAENDPCSPRSTSNSTSSSVYSACSRQSSTLSPNMSHGLPCAYPHVGPSQSPNNPALPHSIFSHRVEYSGMQYPYAATTTTAVSSTQQDQGMQYYHPHANAASSPKLRSPKSLQQQQQQQQQAPVAVRPRKSPLEYGSSYDFTNATVAGEDERKGRMGIHS